MFRPALRTASTASFARLSPSIRASRRFVSTAPPHKKSRSWKSSAARWGLAGALVYYYNTASVFAEEPAHVVHTPPQTSQESETYPTVASISEQRRAQTRTQLPSQTNEPQTATYAAPDAERPAPGSPEELEQEASQEGAFNEETGEINWDCPCLGGMAYGPCGEQFRAAFSCFVFSKEEPKGVDCIEHFKAMQTCFREHPDVYGAELEDDEASLEGEGDQPTAISTEPATLEVRSVEQSQQDQKASNPRPPSDNPVSATSGQQDRAQAATEQIRLDHGATSDQAERFPKSSYDARSGS